MGGQMVDMSSTNAPTTTKLNVKCLESVENDKLKLKKKMKKEIQRIEKRLQIIEKELEKVRNYNVFDDGWQIAKKFRKYDVLALEKHELKSKLTDINLSFNLAVGMTVKDYNGFEFKIVGFSDGVVLCDFDGNEGDVFEYKYYELIKI